MLAHLFNPPENNQESMSESMRHVPYVYVWPLKNKYIVGFKATVCNCFCCC